ncbi:MAG: hypothetical protein JXR40_13185 [Pontiellaceae bacterium]|nr:hypothetical protein [Pontiellaceae bacterium]
MGLIKSHLVRQDKSELSAEECLNISFEQSALSSILQPKTWKHVKPAGSRRCGDFSQGNIRQTRSARGRTACVPRDNATSVAAAVPTIALHLFLPSGKGSRDGCGTEKDRGRERPRR